MANRFDGIYNPQPWVSSYVPLPLEFIAEAGANKQKEYDTNKSQLNKSILDNSIKSISEHDDYRNVYLKSFNDQAQALVNDPNLDFGSFEGKQKVSNLIYQNSNNPNLQILSRSISNKKETLDNVEAIKKEKGAYGYWNDPFLKEERMKQLGINPYIDAQGNPVEYQRQSVLRREDHFKPAEDIFKNIKDSGKINAYAGFSGDKSYIQSGKNGWEGVATETIMEVANRNIGTFITTEGGQDFMRKFEFDYSDQLSKMSPDKAEFYKNEAVKNHLYNIGSAFVHRKDIADVDIKEASGDNSNGPNSKQYNPYAGTLAPASTENNDYKLGNVSVKDVVKPDGTVDIENLNKSTMSWGALLKGMFNPFENTTPWNQTDPDKIKPKEAANEEFYRKVANVAKANGWDKDENGKMLPGNKVVEKTLLSIQNMNTSSGVIYKPLLDDSKNINDKVMLQFNKDQMKNSDGISLNTFIDKAGGKDSKNASFQGFDYSDKEKAMMSFEFTGSDGKKTTESFSISDIDYNQKFSPIAKAVGSTQEKMLDPSKRTTKEITFAKNILLKAYNNDADGVHKMLGDNIGDLYPVGVEVIGDVTLFTYSDSNESGVVRVIAAKPDGNGNQTLHPYQTLNTAIIDASNSFFESSQGKENATKEEKKVTYNK